MTGREMNKKLTIFLILSSLFWGCAREKGEIESKPPPVGWIKVEDLLSQFPEYKKGMETYRPDSLLIEKIKAFEGDLEALVFLGTWCPDCKREVPKFLKILKMANNPRISLRMYGLDRTRESWAGLPEEYGVTHVPTFIFLYKGQEIGRIVESPETTVEGDFVAILTKISLYDVHQ